MGQHGGALPPIFLPPTHLDVLAGGENGLAARLAAILAGRLASGLQLAGGRDTCMVVKLAGTVGEPTSGSHGLPPARQSDHANRCHTLANHEQKRMKPLESLGG